MARPLHEGDGIRDLPLQAGDTLVVHTTWEALARLEKDRNFVVVTTEYPHEEPRPHKVAWARLFFAIALWLVLFTDLRLSVALLTGAMGMVLSGVLTIDEAYEAVSWKTVFLLASLIPLGLAVETSGTAKLDRRPDAVGARRHARLGDPGRHRGAGHLLHPGHVQRRRHRAAGAAGGQHRPRRRAPIPAVFALTVAIATSNSFLIPTHQVNALIMGPGGYRVPDFMRAGGIMTVLFLVVSLVMLNLVF